MTDTLLASHWNPAQESGQSYTVADWSLDPRGLYLVGPHQQRAIYGGVPKGLGKQTPQLGKVCAEHHPAVVALQDHLG